MQQRLPAELHLHHDQYPNMYICMHTAHGLRYFPCMQGRSQLYSDLLLLRPHTHANGSAVLSVRIPSPYKLLVTAHRALRRNPLDERRVSHLPHPQIPSNMQSGKIRFCAQTARTKIKRKQAVMCTIIKKLPVLIFFLQPAFHSGRHYSKTDQGCFRRCIGPLTPAFFVVLELGSDYTGKITDCTRCRYTKNWTFVGHADIPSTNELHNLPGHVEIGKGLETPSQWPYHKKSLGVLSVALH
ncbi:hypothetical protein FN846DRAFT_1010881 [Sphaerosporella brunnea]|uniref:Uncharacterized protein n=1 Tax=Sphaerosporella brunnea TaxID=1250544 RepID=A0A5J5EZR4_9PEZI|nr:hypothetical protein FN846DRAFT_1010881 [Sphaerosporella brunnea]